MDWQAGVRAQLRASARKPLKLRDLAERLQATSTGDRAALKAAVHALLAEGVVERIHGNRFSLAERGEVYGALTAHPDGYAFVTPEPVEVGAADIYIAADDRLGAMHRDRVAVRVTGHGRFGRVRGRVTAVVERGQTRVVGTFRALGRTTVVLPDEARLHHRIRIASADRGGGVDGQKVVCEITKYPTAYGDPAGRVTEVLGFAGEAGVDTAVLLRKHGLPDEFSAAAIAEAETAPATVPDGEIAGRLDLRTVPTVTIDGADAKDLDDAVTLEPLDGGRVRLGVHIADVSRYVRPGSALDEEAYERGTSVYLEDLVVPMLPHELSNGICSLNAGVDRLALSCLMEVDRNGRVRHREIRPTVIRVDHRMTYDAVYEILSHPRSALRKEYGDWTARLEQMDRLAQRLRRLRQRRGSLMFEFPEARAEIDERGAVESIVLRDVNRAHQLIEEFMLLANETVARYLHGLDAPCLFRVHERPEADAIERFLDFVTSLGMRVTAKTPVEPRDLQAVSEAAKGRPEEALVNTLMLRAMQRARYAAEHAGHFGLASGCYCHFTSPIRRYPDLMVHRLLYLVAEESVDAARAHWGRRLAVIAQQCSERERVAMDAERESLRLKQLLFMERHVGDTFPARVTGVQRYGLFVETVEELADGLVHVSELDDDYYTLVEDEHCLEGADTGRRYTLGDALTVQVLRVDVERQELDFRIVLPEGEAPPAPVRRRRAPARGRRAGARTRSNGRRR